MPEKDVALFESTGFVPSAQVMTSVLSQGDMQRLYYQTTSGQEFGARGKSLKSENMADVHNIGHRSGRYWQFQPNHAKSCGRSHCEYTRVFPPHSLGDFATSKEFAKNNKACNEAVNLGGPKDCVNTAMTKYQEDFKQPTSRQMRKARPKSHKPKDGHRTQTIHTQGTQAAQLSHSHATYGVPQGLSLVAQVSRAKTTLGVSPLEGSYKTSYAREFVPPPADTESRKAQLQPKAKPARSSSAPAVGRRDQPPHSGADGRVRKNRCSSAPSVRPPAIAGENLARIREGSVSGQPKPKRAASAPGHGRRPMPKQAPESLGWAEKLQCASVVSAVRDDATEVSAVSRPSIVSGAGPPKESDRRRRCISAPSHGRRDAGVPEALVWARVPRSMAEAHGCETLGSQISLSGVGLGC